MARSTDRIEDEISAARDRLASTLDELAQRADPHRLVDNTKHAVVGTVNEPKVKYSLAGAGLLVLLLLLVKIFRR